MATLCVTIEVEYGRWLVKSCERVKSWEIQIRKCRQFSNLLWHVSKGSECEVIKSKLNLNAVVFLLAGTVSLAPIINLVGNQKNFCPERESNSRPI